VAEERKDFPNENEERFERLGENDIEEFAEEAAPTLRPLTLPEEQRPAGEDGAANEGGGAAGVEAADGRAMGWFAFVLAVVSLFVWPVFLGPTAAVIGFFAYARGSRALGIWSIVIGGIAFVAALLLAPFFNAVF
jgi:hypothetical protein